MRVTDDLKNDRWVCMIVGGKLAVDISNKELLVVILWILHLHNLFDFIKLG